MAERTFFWLSCSLSVCARKRDVVVVEDDVDVESDGKGDRFAPSLALRGWTFVLTCRRLVGVNAATCR